jgi:hypothetical protein
VYLKDWGRGQAITKDLLFEPTGDSMPIIGVFGLAQVMIEAEKLDLKDRRLEER